MASPRRPRDILGTEPYSPVALFRYIQSQAPTGAFQEHVIQWFLQHGRTRKQAREELEAHVEAAWLDEVTGVVVKPVVAVRYFVLQMPDDDT